MFQKETQDVEKVTKKDLINEKKVVIYTYQMKRDVKNEKGTQQTFQNETRRKNEEEINFNTSRSRYAGNHGGRNYCIC